MKPAVTRTPTLKLAAARLEFSRDRRFTNALHLAAVAALVFLFIMIGWRLYVDSRSSATVLAGLRQQNAALRADLSRALLELELERSTRAALARQVAELNEEIARAEEPPRFLQRAKRPPGQDALTCQARQRCRSLEDRSMFRRKTDQPSIDVSRLSSLIAAGVEIAGDVVVTDGVRIDGQVVGNVLSKPDTRGLLVLSELGRIEGNVSVHDAVINGTICGDLEVENFIELQANARITGAIKYRTLQMTCGARVEGSMVCIVDRAEARVATTSNVVSLSKVAES